MIPAAQVVEIRHLFFAEHWRVGTIATQCDHHQRWASGTPWARGG